MRRIYRFATCFLLGMQIPDSRIFLLLQLDKKFVFSEKTDIHLQHSQSCANNDNEVKVNKI